jgi:transposase
MRTSQKTPETITTIGIDLGKNTFHLVGLDKRGAIVLQLKVSRGQLGRRLSNMPRCLIGMEACSGSHHIGRQLAALGQDVRLIPAQYVKPFLKGHKNDYRDAEAIAEAVQRPTMHFVAIKTPQQMDLLALHRVRSRLVGQRTGVINQIRGFLIERGITVRQGVVPLRRALPDILSANTDVLSPRMVSLIADLAQDWRRLDARIESVSTEIEALAEQDDSCRHRSGSIATCWRSRSPTSLPASPGRFSPAVAPISQEWSPQMPPDKGSLRPTKGMPATPLRHHRSPRGVSERRRLRGDGFT